MEQCDSTLKLNSLDPNYNEDDATIAYCTNDKNHGVVHANEYFKIVWRDSEEVYHSVAQLKSWKKG